MQIIATHNLKPGMTVRHVQSGEIITIGDVSQVKRHDCSLIEICASKGITRVSFNTQFDLLDEDSMITVSAGDLRPGMLVKHCNTGIVFDIRCVSEIADRPQMINISTYSDFYGAGSDFSRDELFHAFKAPCDRCDSKEEMSQDRQSLYDQIEHVMGLLNNLQEELKEKPKLDKKIIADLSNTYLSIILAHQYIRIKED